jgi:tyrosyl-tRNA synthetase
MLSKSTRKLSTTLEQNAISFQSPFMQQFRDRGFMHQCTDANAIDQSFQNGPVTAYLGFDATAGSLHVGSLVQIMILRLLQRCGHKPIVLLGGGTTRVGDPSGKDKSRAMLDDQVIAANTQSLAKIFHKFLDFEETNPNAAVIVNNADWLNRLNYLDFLRDYGRHFSVNRMLSFDSVKTRLAREEQLSFLEFNYMILQAYDFMELNRKHGVVLQIGGSDQWGNIVSGIDLARKVRQIELFGLTTPLITTSSGSKMGKSEAGAIWLDRYAFPVMNE